MSLISPQTVPVDHLATCKAAPKPFVWIDVFRLLSVLLFAAVTVFASGFSVAEESKSDPFKVISAKTAKGEFSWTIELASDDDSRATGLMNRKSMAPLHGMLFRFDQTENVSMWMKNTFIPLDMIFTDEAGRVSHIHKGAVPHSRAIIDSNGPVRFVLEVNAGEVDETGLKVGTQLKHPWFAGSE